MATIDLARAARERLVRLTNDWQHWQRNESEILSLALGLVGCQRVEDFAPSVPVRPVILAGGKGTRAQLDHPKVLAEVKGQPALYWVLETLYSIPNVQPAVLITSDYRDYTEQIQASLDGRYSVEYVVESDPQGTGHAVWQACHEVEGLRPPDSFPATPDSFTVLVTEGTQAMMQRSTVLKSILIHEAVGSASMTIPTTRKERPYAYLVRDQSGFVCDSRETRLENAEIVDYGEDNVSLYLVRGEELYAALQHARRRALDAATGRYRQGQLGFPNEMVKSLRGRGKLVMGLCFADLREAQSMKYAEDVERIERYLDEMEVRKSRSPA